MSSNYINFLNFILFDVLLISLIFFLTADVSGRLNHLSLLDGSKKPLIVISPPLVGGGLCSTNKRRSFVMLSVRIVAITLIFATAFTIEGDTIQVVRSRQETVRVPGPVPAGFNKTQIEAASSYQQSCQISSQGFIYHGRLSKNGRCESNPSLLQDQIRVRTSHQPINVTLPCEPVETSRNSRRVVREYRCPHQTSVIQCFQGVERNFSAQSCQGTVETPDKSSYICNTFEAREKNGTWFAQCRLAFNLNRARDYWTKAGNLTNINLVELIGGTSVLALKGQKVKYIESKDITTVHKAWFGFFAAKIALVLVFIAVSCSLRKKGVRCILHDEHALMLLLRVNISQKFGLPNDQVSLYLHSSTKKNRGYKTFWVSARPQLRPNNAAVHQLEMDNL